MTPCVRSHPARLVLGLSGLLVAALGAGWLVLADDTVGGGSPGTLLGTGGAVMIGGALLGGLAALVDGDRRSPPDRVRPETLGLAYGLAQGTVLGEVVPGTMHARWAPSWYFPRDRGRLRFSGYAGGMLGREVHVDPRPAIDPPASAGTRRTSFGLGLDLALSLPYRGHRRSLGPIELRWRPEIHVRRDLHGEGGEDPLLAARTMLLPLTLGVRWHLSARQRFTAYVGPRLDFLAFSETGRPPLRRGPPQIGSFHGEFWYDLDIPLTRGPVDRRGRTRRAAVQSQLSIGYVHSRFGAAGLNVGGIIGYLGVLGAAYRVRVRPRGAAYALQFGALASLGARPGGVLEFGVVLPDLGLRRDGGEERRAI